MKLNWISKIIYDIIHFQLMYTIISFMINILIVITAILCYIFINYNRVF